MRIQNYFRPHPGPLFRGEGEANCITRQFHGNRVIAVFLFAIFSASSAFAELSPAPPAKDDGKWESLFNGQDLSGWTAMNEGTFRATNGVLQLTGGKGWLRTAREFTNFIFEAEWRALETNYNGGFFLRAAADGQPFPTNVWQVNLKEKALGELLKGSQKMVTTVMPPQPVGAWVKFRVEVHGQKLALDVNGMRLWEFSEFEPRQGFIGLQAEGKAFEFRNLRVRELN